MSLTERASKQPLAFLGEESGLSIDVEESSVDALALGVSGTDNPGVWRSELVGISWLVRKIAGSSHGERKRYTTLRRPTFTFPWRTTSFALKSSRQRSLSRLSVPTRALRRVIFVSRLSGAVGVLP